MPRYLSFDLEIAALIPEGCTDWDSLGPLGITCGAAAWRDGDEIKTRTWAAQADRMAPKEVDAMVNSLMVDITFNRLQLLTWNGLSFDMKMLHNEGDQTKDLTRSLAMSELHIDPCFHIVCQLGWPVGLKAAAKGMGVAGKLDGMTGAEAPQRWADGERQLVIDYCEQDARAQLEVTEAADREAAFSWYTKRGEGKQRTMDLIDGWLPVPQALELREPDTSWMTEPDLWARRRFYEWVLS